jgi:ATP-dependent helicase HepA
LPFRANQWIALKKGLKKKKKLAISAFLATMKKPIKSNDRTHKPMLFTIGQRWISNTESQLGLGVVTEVNGRQITLSFPAVEEDRIYAIDNAPLSRIVFTESEDLYTENEEKLNIIGTEEHDGLMFYTCVDDAGKERQIVETQISSFLKLNTPHQRLFSGLLDKLESFQLRVETLYQRARLHQSKARGLLGSRTSHLPHQVYIAKEVGLRHAPRVLLADEVGLGKTIEAGMIIHYQLLTGHAQRVLILVPETLIHQWFVEMIRRFNLHFSIFDESRLEQAIDSKENSFETEQLVLCSIELLLHQAKARKQALSAPWDLLVVDEAHHLEMNSTAFHCVEQLAQKSKGLLLLTATPEQVGIESHFARLQLLDPARFHSFNAFKKQEAAYKHINELVNELLAYKEEEKTDELSVQLKKKLKPYLGKQLTNSITSAINNLLDQHGTGRVFFRNTRAAIHGFPKRQLHAYPLPQPELYKEVIALYPEEFFDNELWLKQDPRVAWLVKQLQSLRPEKVLVICAKARTALALESHLKQKSGIRVSAFHEGLTLIERDRAAAHFAEHEHGAQALICSEIGSEGRNFQFAQHLILFDLSLNPDLLEQRIGRLDRIGQKNTIKIHVPYLSASTQETLFRWYHEGISLFEQSCSIGFSIFQKFEKPLMKLLQKPNEKELNALIDETKDYVCTINEALQEGRDRLIEMNSCKKPIADELIKHIEKDENDVSLQAYMGKVFQEYGVDHEHHSEDTEILHPTDHMKFSHFPGLHDDSVTVTYSRAKALVREDIQFLSWEHPMVYEAMDMILNSELGNATLTTLSIRTIAPGTLFLESFFSVHCTAPKDLQLDRFLPLKPIRLLMDLSGKNLSKIMDYNQLNALCEPVKSHLDSTIVKQVRPNIEIILEHSTKVGEKSMAESIAKATAHMKEHLDQEINRLTELQKINPSVRKEEIQFLKDQRNSSEYYLKNTVLKLEALRVVINK